MSAALLLLTAGVMPHDDGTARERRADTRTRIKFLGHWAGASEVPNKREQEPIRFYFLEPGYVVELKNKGERAFKDHANFLTLIHDSLCFSLQISNDGKGVLGSFTFEDYACLWREEGHRIRLFFRKNGCRPDSFEVTKDTSMWLLEPQPPQKKK